MSTNPYNFSIWEQQTYFPYTDFLIIGSGIVGLSTAIFLKERYPLKKVTVLERGILPSGASTKNAGFACIGSPSELIDDLSKNNFEVVWETVAKRFQGLKRLRELLGDKGIGYQELGSHELFRNKEVFDQSIDALDELNKNMALITGQKNVFRKSENPSVKFGFNGFEYAIEHKAEGQIDTGKMMQTLIRKALSLHVEVLNGIEVKEIRDSHVETNIGELKFGKVAVCTNGFAKRILNLNDVEPARAQVLVTKPIENLPFQGIFHFDEGYYYFRNVGSRILFGGGRNLDFKGENTFDMQNSDLIVNELKRILKTEIIPGVKHEIDFSWAGIMGVGNKKMPIIKPVSEKVYCGVRLGGMGVAIGVLVGEELARLMVD